MAKRRCLGCGYYILTGSRCAMCRTRQKAKYSDPTYQANRRLVLVRDGYKCQIKGPRCTVSATEADHIDPHGPSEVWNMRASCRPCNAGKRDR